MNTIKKVLIVFILFSVRTFCQHGALPFTTMQQSVFLLGTGQIGSALPNDDVLGFYFNPAVLGYSGRNNHVSIELMPSKTQWIFSPSMNLNNYGINLGYTFNNNALSLPISLGLGYIHSYFDYGESNLINPNTFDIIGKYKSYDEFDCFSLGIGFDYFLKFNLGLSLKTFNSVLGKTFINEKLQDVNADGSMVDIGALIIFPISDIFFSSTKIEIDKDSYLKPKMNFSVGNSVLNLGKEIYYIDPAQIDPLSRSSRLGYTLDFGFDFKLKKVNLNLITYSFSAEAEDLLLTDRTEENPGIHYQSINHDVNIFENLIKLNSNSNIVIHKGNIFSFFETFTLTTGSYIGKGYSKAVKTFGLGFTTNAIFKFFNDFSENETILFLTKHFEINYYHSNIEFNNSYDNDIFTFSIPKVNFNAIAIKFKNFEI